MRRRDLLQLAAASAACTAGPAAAWSAARSLSVSDRLDVQDLLARALWAMDTGDAAGLLEALAEGASIQDEHGRSWGPRAYAAHLAGAGHRPGLFHEAQVNRVRTSGRRVIVEAYWSAFSWPEGRDGPGMEDLAICTDTCVKTAGRWRIAERRIRTWDSTTVRVDGCGSR